MKTKHLLFIPIIITIITGSCYVSGDFSAYEYVQKITNDLRSTSNTTNITQAQRIMNQLCVNIYKEAQQKTSNHLYDPTQSLFVTIFCGSFTGSSSVDQNNTIAGYLKRKNFSDMTLFCSKGQVENNDPYCIPESKDNSLDYNYLMLKLIKQVQNDWSNIGLAHAYGLQNQSTSKSEADIANNYLAIYYNVLGKQPEAKDYPKTYKQLIQYIKNSKKILQKLYFIDNKKVINDEAKVIEKNVNKEFQGLWQELFFNKEDSQDTIVHAMYNELFLYTLFSSVYNEYLPNFWGTSKDNIPQGLQDIKYATDRILYIQSQGKQQRESIQKTTQQTLKEINNLQSSFPIHIGFLLYEEDLYKLRKRLSNIYLPLHQLHYKLENVQSKE